MFNFYLKAISDDPFMSDICGYLKLCHIQIDTALRKIYIKASDRSFTNFYNLKKVLASYSYYAQVSVYTLKGTVVSTSKNIVEQLILSRDTRRCDWLRHRHLHPRFIIIEQKKDNPRYSCSFMYRKILWIKLQTCFSEFILLLIYLWSKTMLLLSFSISLSF